MNDSAIVELDEVGSEQVPTQRAGGHNNNM